MVMPSLLVTVWERLGCESSEHCLHCHPEVEGRWRAVERSAVVVEYRYLGRLIDVSRQEEEGSNLADDPMLEDVRSAVALLVHLEELV